MKRLLLSATLATISIAVLSSLGDGVLARPPLGSIDTLTLWLADRDAITAAFAGVRLVALLAAWYLLAISVLALGARLTGVAILGRLANRLALPPMRRLLVGATSASLLLASPVPVDAEPAPPDTAVMVLLDETGATTTLPTATPQTGTDPTTTMTLLDETPPRPPPPAPDERDKVDQPQPPSEEHLVEAGDCFWSIAEDALAQAWGRSPTDAEIVDYWVPLIEHNRGRLVDPANPDLLYPGQTLELLPVPGATG